MFNRRIVLVAGVVLIVLGLVGFFLSSKLKSSKAGLLIQTNPQAVVYINNEEVGTTPYDGVLKSGEVTVRLVPVVTSGTFAPWGTKLTLVDGIKTVIKRDFGETESLSSGEVLSFEKISGNNSSLTIVSSPDASQVILDGEIKGFTPLPLESVTSGQHTIIISQPGHAERTINTRTEPGYKLTVVAMLAELAQQEVQVTEATPSAQITQDKVTILETPTGFLRVRNTPSTSASEEAQVKPGEEFVLLEEKTGWYRIEYKKGQDGWVSSQYAKKE